MPRIGQSCIARTGEERIRCMVRYSKCEVQSLGSGMHRLAGEAKPRPPVGHVEAGFDLREVRSRIVQCLRCPAIAFAEGRTVLGNRIVRCFLGLLHLFFGKRIIAKGLAVLLILLGSPEAFDGGVIEKALWRIHPMF